LEYAGVNIRNHFYFQMYNQEIKEVVTRRQVEISELDNRLVEEYNAKLQLSLQELREQYECQMRANREDIEVLYENKVSICDHNNQQCVKTMQFFRCVTLRIKCRRIVELLLKLWKKCGNTNCKLIA
jgi:hypothetical protein